MDGRACEDSFLRYLFSDEKTDHQENEVLIVLIPRFVRMPEWTKANLRPCIRDPNQRAAEAESDIRAPSAQPPAPAPAQQSR